MKFNTAMACLMALTLCITSAWAQPEEKDPTKAKPIVWGRASVRSLATIEKFLRSFGLPAPEFFQARGLEQKKLKRLEK